MASWLLAYTTIVFMKYPVHDVTLHVRTKKTTFAYEINWQAITTDHEYSVLLQ